MKKFKYITIKGNEKFCKGKQHFILLSNGEKVEVYTNRQRAKEKSGKLSKLFWCVSDAQSGLQIAGFTEYFIFFNFIDYKNNEETLLRIAKEKLECAIKGGVSISSLRDKRVMKIKQKLLKENL